MKRFLLLAPIVFPLLVQAQSISAPQCPLPAACQPGDSITVSSSTLTSNATVSSVTLAPSRATGQNYSSTATMGGASLTFVLPRDIPDGTYNLQIKQTAKPDQNKPVGQPATQTSTQGEIIAALSPSQIVVQRPSITAVSPKAAFLDEKGAYNQVTILGSGFRGENDADGKTRTMFQFTELRTPNLCKGDPRRNCYELKLDNDHQATLTFYDLQPKPEYYSGPWDFKFSVDGFLTNSDKLALIDTRAWIPMTLALASLALILGLLFGLIHWGRTGIKRIFGNKAYILSALFLDVQTQTYSLSKCQFYAWTAASALGYLFLAISRSYVQGSATFPDIPSGLPGILMASAGTAVVSNGISGAKGDKGAGEPGPSLSDFVASGGLVAADRLQFVVWTIIGIGTFLAIIFRSDPRNISDLPAIPLGFLQLMGISAAGYIAGKVVRKAGPVLNNIAPSGSPNELIFQLTGSGLSQSALFFIDGAQIFPDTILGKTDDAKLPEIVQQDSTAGETFARILRFRVKKPPQGWFGGPHNFNITNPDGQKATISYQIFRINKDSITIDPQKKTLSMTGECIDKSLKVACIPATPANTQPIEVKPDQDKITSDRYVGTLELPDGVTEVTVTVEDGPGTKIEQAGIKVGPPPVAAAQAVQGA
jgi:hypothetical protein